MGEEEEVKERWDTRRMMNIGKVNEVKANQVRDRKEYVTWVLQLEKRGNGWK